ncbi:hypothetical protein N7474_003444 [Penicillium riverlandense]|uniref:uncharacterized protein n=1 Tax=Penicillium riverlandense TaxID=1903569 RepID=UPI00254775D3|nr:uncharacterized protein N7474_003444 [Penicillium riverlandense]KAJ5826306.1 hypothetical protein N7474_003444 [Penicillium riverlandense]
MMLRVYDDLPDPSVRQNRHSLSAWVVEGKNLASRAHNRASMHIRRKSNAQNRISAPYDFHYVGGFQPPPVPAVPSQFRPLELSIYHGGKRLSDLPSFEAFSLEDRPQRKTLAVPPRALASAEYRMRRTQSTAAAFTIPRKPTPSAGDIEQLVEQPAPVRVTSALIPHFSVVTPVVILPPPVDLSSPVSDDMSLHSDRVSPFSPYGYYPSPAEIEAATRLIHDAIISSTPVSPKTPSPISDLEGVKQIEAAETLEPSSQPQQVDVENHHRHTTPENFFSNPVTGWFQPHHHHDNKDPSTYDKQASVPGEKGFEFDRTRTSSGSTVGTSITAATVGPNRTRHNSSVSSTMTNTPSLHGYSPSTEKDLEAGISLSHRISTPRNSYPTIYEDHQQQSPQSEYEYPSSDDSRRWSGPAVGVAF